MKLSISVLEFLRQYDESTKWHDAKETKHYLNLYNLANRNLETINKIEDRNKWLWRTSVGALITGLIGILILFIKLGLGIN